MLARLAGATARGVAGPRGACAAVRRIKTTTGIVGLDVEPEAKSILEDLYAKTLTALEAFPADAEYRSVVEALTKERLAVVKGTSDLDKIEATLGAGQARHASRSSLHCPAAPPCDRWVGAPPQVEQVIEQARDELELIPILAAARVWESYDGSTTAEEIYTDLKRCTERHHCPPSLRAPASTLRLAAGEGSRCSGTTSRCASRSTIRPPRPSISSRPPPLRRRRRSELTQRLFSG